MWGRNDVLPKEECLHSPYWSITIYRMGGCLRSPYWSNTIYRMNALEASGSQKNVECFGMVDPYFDEVVSCIHQR